MLLSLLSKEDSQYLKTKEMLFKIHSTKVDYLMKANVLYLLTKELNRFSVKVNLINYSEKDNIKKISLNLLSFKNEKITDLLKHLTSTYNGKFKFLLKDIFYDKEKKRYLSKLEVIVL